MYRREYTGQIKLEEFNIPFYGKLNPKNRWVKLAEIVAGDGAKWIDSCVEKHFPNAVRCIDFFHTVAWANEALDKVRTQTVKKGI